MTQGMMNLLIENVCFILSGWLLQRPNYFLLLGHWHSKNCVGKYKVPIWPAAVQPKESSQPKIDLHQALVSPPLSLRTPPTLPWPLNKNRAMSSTSKVIVFAALLFSPFLTTQPSLSLTHSPPPEPLQNTEAFGSPRSSSRGRGVQN